MTYVARVIVDVSAYPVDRPFDYLVPDQWRQVIDKGCRVKVPFGPRNVLGFVVDLKTETDVPLDKLKPISQVLDLEAVLTEEMLELATWLKHQTICYEIDALQVMLPGALRAKYEKFVYLQGEVEQLAPNLQPYFAKSSKVNMAVFEKEGLLREVKLAATNKQLVIENSVKQQGAVKHIRKIKIGTKQALDRARDHISKRAQKQLLLLEWMQGHAEEVWLPDALYKEAQTSDAVLKAVIEKGAAQFVQEEVYRDPFKKDVARTAFLQLTDEQEVVLSKIKTALDEQRPETFLLQGVTGSGKTEVYLQAIQSTLAQGKEAIMLVPEISLTPQMTERFRSRFGDQVAVMHSGLSLGEKYDEWRKIQKGEVKVVVGARSAVFAPFTNVGLQ